MLRIFLILTALAAGTTASAQTTKPQKPKFLYGHDVKVRNVGEANFTAATPKVGIEFFHDPVGDVLIAITEAGHLAVAPMGGKSDKTNAEWVTAFELRVRDAAVDSFKDAKKVAAETFKDHGSGKLLTITAQKTAALADVQTSSGGAEPEWHHALKLKARGPEDKDFSSARQFGIECFRDPSTGGLIYLTDQGFIARAAAPSAASAAGSDAKAVKDPKALHGLSLMVRKADEGDFDKAKAFGLEAYHDPNSNAMIYMCESGSIAAVPMGDVKTGQGVRWSHSFALKARKGGEKDFDKAGKYGIEVFEDKNTGALIYICETGSIAAIRK